MPRSARACGARAFRRRCESPTVRGRSSRRCGRCSKTETGQLTAHSCVAFGSADLLHLPQAVRIFLLASHLSDEIQISRCPMPRWFVPCSSPAFRIGSRALVLAALVASSLTLASCASANAAADDGVRAQVLDSHPVHLKSGAVNYVVTFEFLDSGGVSNTVTVELDRERWLQSGAGA